MVGDLVHVKGVILPDGTLLAKEIKRRDNHLVCLSFSTAVREIQVDQIVPLDWQVIQLGANVNVQGQINVATVILVSGCVQQGVGFSITHIVVICQLDAIPVIIKPPSNNGGGGGDDDDDDDDDDD